MKVVIALLVISILLHSCSKDDEVVTLSSADAKAESVFLTRDHHDRPVVVWTENKNGNLTLIAARSERNRDEFRVTCRLPLTSDVATHAESMPKVAFAGDGTIVAAYEKKTPTETNKYAGAIFYRVSQDGGKSWTEEMFLHNDTVAGRSRSYFDIDRLPDGTIGAAWLDVKLDNKNGGRTLRFAKTVTGQKFGSEVLVDSSACQCCRIDVYSHQNNDVVISYRGLKKGAMGRQIRDMMIVSSSNGGSTFSAPFVISADNWNIDGCPHTGPSICGNKGGLISLWYTEGTGTGVFFATKSTNDKTFSAKNLVSSEGRHPQLCANGEKIAMLWEENTAIDVKNVTAIHYRWSVNGEETKIGTVTPVDRNAFSPVITSFNDGFLIAYLIENDQGQTIVQLKNL